MEYSITGSIIAHLGISCVVCYFILTKKIQAPMSLTPIIVFIPIWGAICTIAADRISRSGKCGEAGIHERDDFFPAALSYTLPAEEGLHQSDIIPLEEAMLINDPAARRTLIMEIVQENPAKYLPTLKKVGFMGDHEVMHYTTTVIMEMQEEFESSIFRAKQHYQSDPYNKKYIELYAQVLQKYIDSGLLEGSLLRNKHTQYRQLNNSLKSLQKQEKPQSLDPSPKVNTIDMGI